MEKKLSRREFLKASAATGAILCMTPALASAQEAKSLELLKPQAGSGNSLMQLLWKRSSSRQFGPEPVPVGVLSNLLWAGFGINRPDGRRTAPSAHNCQDIDIYVILREGLYLYDAKANQLKLVLAEDLRGLAGTQPYVKEAPVNLIYVSDYARMADKMPADEKALFPVLSGIHTGVIAENVCLYCASEGLATVVRVMIDIPALSKAMKLRPDQKITLAQSVGYPRKTA
ncbi:MAG TPA: SagB/ThcOx family dehydrogenase [Syntrophorhabdales bacterium]|nr:SagB/ThcOx family dehydrogenase [Syntrophorhabdales bacterium]